MSTDTDETKPPTILENRVRFAETDMQGIVFYGAFFTYQDETLNEYLRQIDYRYARMREQGWTTHIVHAELDYRASATYEDVLQNEMRIASIGESSFAVDYTARQRDDGTTVVEGGAVHVTVDVETDDAIRVPEDFRDAVVEFQDTPPDPV